MKSLHIFITTEPAPDDHRQWTKWGLRLIQSFRHRWGIESGFAGLEKAKPASHARSNETKLLQWTFGMFQSNCWQIEKALFRRLKDVSQVVRRGPSMWEFGEKMNRILVAQG